MDSLNLIINWLAIKYNEIDIDKYEKK